MEVKKQYLIPIVLIILVFLYLVFVRRPVLKPLPKPEIELIRLTKSPSDELNPVFSPDGKKIAYTERFINNTKVIFNIRVMSIDGEEDKLILSTSDLLEICSEDGFTNFSSLEIHRLSWFEDRILFNTWCSLPNEGKIIKMVMVSPDGSNPRTIGAGEHPHWSSNGEKIVYLFKKSVYVPGCERCGKELWIRDDEGSRLIYKQNHTLFWPSFSPDGSKIVFERREEDKRNDIYLINIDGSDLKKLTTSYDNTYPCFTPDGNEIAFVSNRSGADEIYFLSLETEELRKLTNVSAIEACCINFSPEGDMLFSMLTEEGDKGFDIWMLKRG